MPNPANPQNFNRFGYVLNNPVNLIDPSGHICVNNGGTNSEVAMTGDCHGGVNKKLNNGLLAPEWNNHKAEKDEGKSKPVGLIDSYCVDSTSELYCIANAAQDIATLIDIVGAGVEFATISIGCFVGGLGGCFAGWKAGVKLWNIPIIGPLSLNRIEAIFSTASFAFTLTADFDDNRRLGENSATSFITWALGQVSPDPIIDFAIDGYASGYNHGIFNDVIKIINGESIIKRNE